MALNSLLSDVALAKQTVKGTPATAPTYVMPLKDGQAASFEPTDTVDEETGQNYATSAYREEVAVGSDFAMRAYPGPLGLLLYAALGGITTVGSAAPYKHTFTVADRTPWLTLWPKTDVDFVQINDAKLDQLTVSFSGNEPLLVESTFAGLSFDKTGSRPAGGVNVAGLEYFTPASGVFKVAGAGSTPLEVAINNFSLAISRNLTSLFSSGTPLPSDLSLGRASFAPSITVRPEDDLSLFWEIATGSKLGTAPSTVTILGSFEIEVHIDDNTKLTLKADRVPWKCDYPGANPSGGAIELPLSADDILGNATTSPVSIELTNAVASY